VSLDILAVDHSDKAWLDFFCDCMDDNSLMTHNRELRKKHVNKSFNNTVAVGLFQFGITKRLIKKTNQYYCLCCDVE